MIFWNQVILQEHFNLEGLIGISDYTFKVIPQTEQVFVIKHLDAANTELQQFQFAGKVADLPNKSQIFSFEDDVFGLLDNEETTCEDLTKCDGECITGNTEDIAKLKPYCTKDNGEEFKYKLKIKYAKFGIFKEILLEWTNKCYKNCLNNYNIESELGIAGLIVSKCGVQKDFNESYETKFNHKKHKFNLARGTKCLSKIDLKAWIRFVDPCDSTIKKYTEVKIKAEG